MTPFTGRVSLRSLSVVLLALLLVPQLAGVILFGAAKHCLTLMRAAFVADLYGPAHYASIAGVLAFSVTIAQAAAPPGADAAYDALAALAQRHSWNSESELGPSSWQPSVTRSTDLRRLRLSPMA